MRVELVCGHSERLLANYKEPGLHTLRLTWRKIIWRNTNLLQNFEREAAIAVNVGIRGFVHENPSSGSSDKFTSSGNSVSTHEDQFTSLSASICKISPVGCPCNIPNIICLALQNTHLQRHSIPNFPNLLLDFNRLMSHIYYFHPQTFIRILEKHHAFYQTFLHFHLAFPQLDLRILDPLRLLFLSFEKNLRKKEKDLLQLVANGVGLEKVLEKDFVLVCIEIGQTFLHDRFGVTVRKTGPARVALEAVAKMPGQAGPQFLVCKDFRATFEHVLVGGLPARIWSFHFCPGIVDELYALRVVESFHGEFRHHRVLRARVSFLFGRKEPAC
ncbi:phosphotransferases [Striga asiatica]|uniref:Phosphotransferases n=1 Tax=Striga asiatica TaxID=4170 RepID=A0A5A7RKK3_STRAF|nr:phosphotransferases [Striga asiatica]